MMASVIPDEPVSGEMLREHVEMAKKYARGGEERMKGNVNAVAAVVKSETEKLQYQLDSLAKQSVEDLPKHWENVKSSMEVAMKRIEREIGP